MATSAYLGYVNQALTAGQRRMEFGRDLAWRWFTADPTKRDSIPLVPKGYAKSLTEYGSYEAFYSDYMLNNLLAFSYYFKSLEGDETWDVTSPNAQIEYGKWYDWFEGTTPGAGGGGAVPGENITDAVTSPLTLYRVIEPGQYESTAGFESSTVQVSLTGTTLGRVNGHIQQYGNFLMLEGRKGGGTSSIQIFYLYSESPMTYTYEYTGTTVGVQKRDLYSVTITSDSVIKRANEGWHSNTQNNISYSLSGSTTTYTITEMQWLYASNLQEGSGGGGQEPDDAPVLPPEDPAPQRPGGTTVTIGPVTNVTNQTTTTTADLTPILEAIRILNDNLTAYGDGLIDGLQAGLTALLDEMQECWEALWSDLDEITTYLRGIYQKLGSGGSSKPDPNLDDSGYDTWLDNLLERLLSMLPSAATEAITTLARLQNVFPFSIPYDVGAILGLMSATPARPDVSLALRVTPDYTWTARLNPTADWDVVALVFRRCVLLLWAAQLALWTPQVFEIWRSWE